MFSGVSACTGGERSVPGKRRRGGVFSVSRLQDERKFDPMLPDVLELWDFKRNDVTEIRYDFPHTARQIDAHERNEACPGGVAPEAYTPVSRLQDVKKYRPYTSRRSRIMGY